MKRFKILGIFLVLALVFCARNIFSFRGVSADSKDSVWEISESAVFEGASYSFSSMETAISITSGAEVTFKNCTFEGSEEQTKITNMFLVESSSKLVLENITFLDKNNLKIQNCVNNDGVVEITNVDFIGTCSVFSTSKCENPILFHSGTLTNVNLQCGYICVFEDTKFSKTCQITLAKHEFVDEDFSGKLVLKGIGENVFASKYLSYLTLAKPIDGRLVLDYVGDGIDTDIQNLYLGSSEHIHTGDILVTLPNMSFSCDNIDTTFASMYCTANSFIETQISNEDYTLYCLAGTQNYLDNYTAVKRTGQRFTKLSPIDTLTLKVTTNTTNQSTFETYSYFCKMNKAIFVDIPDGYELDEENIQYFYNSSPDDTKIRVSKIQSNTYYFRCIVEYISESSKGGNLEIQFNFKSKVQAPTLSILKDENIEIHYDELNIGSRCKFSMPINHIQKVTDVTFNNASVDLQKSETEYTFEAVIQQGENQINISSIPLPLKISVTPKSFSFEYEDNISMQETLFVPTTNETVVIEYTPNGNTVGTHKITEAKVQTNGYIFSEDYTVEILGSAEYTVSPKAIELDSIYSLNHETVDYEYDENLNIEYMDFLSITNANFTVTSTSMTKITHIGKYAMTITFGSNSENYVLKDGINTVTVYANILPKNVSLSPTFNDVTYTYDGTEKNIYVSNIPDYVSVSYVIRNSLDAVVKNITNAGTYTVEATLSTSPLYKILTDTKLTAKLIINKKVIDLSEYCQKVKSQQITYDANYHTIDLFESILDGAVSASTTQDLYKDVGTYNYIVSLSFDAQNYECIDSVSCTLEIQPRLVKVTLQTSTFTYTGNEISLVPVISNVLAEDIVTANIRYTELIHAGGYSVTVLGLSNKNYYTTTSIIPYTIQKANLDMSSISFEDEETVYDGQEHIGALTLSSPLPSTVKYKVSGGITNVGKSKVTLSFSQDKQDYNLPKSMTAQVTILPRELTISFSMGRVLADGNLHTPAITILGAVHGEKIETKVQYSSEPILAGTYVCVVSISNSNYVIMGDNTFTYDIYTPKISATAYNTSIIVEGMFLPDTKLLVSENIATKEQVDIALESGLRVVSSMRLNCQNLAKYPATVTMSVAYTNPILFNPKTNTIIQSTMKNGQLIFAMSEDEMDIFICETSATNSTSNLLPLILCLCILLPTIAATIYLLVRFQKKKKKIKDTK